MPEREEIPGRVIIIEVPAKELRELNEAWEAGDPIAEYIRTTNILWAENKMKEVGYIVSGEKYRISFVESDTVFLATPERNFKIIVPAFNDLGRLVDVDIFYHTDWFPADHKN